VGGATENSERDAVVSKSARCENQHRSRSGLFRQAALSEFHPPQLRLSMVGRAGAGVGDAGKVGEQYLEFHP